MKALLIVMFLILITSLLMGAPLRNVPTEVNQPDGTNFKCFMTGDEYYHRIHDAKGYTIIQNPSTGWFVYAEKQGLELVPSIHVPGEADPVALGLTPNLMIDEAKIMERVERFRGPNQDQYGRTSTIGTVNNISIFVRFSDQLEYTDAISTYDNMFNSTTSASLKGFFLEESNSQLTVGTTFYPPAVGGIVRSYQDPNPRAYYSPYNAATNPIGYTTPDQGFCRLHLMLAYAVLAVSGTIPPTLNVDHDSDGIVDNISFICQGPTDAWADVLWPHYWNLDYYNVNPIGIPPYSVPLVFINGSQVDDYNFELSGAPIDVAVVCHEFSHTLGFPDLYHYVSDGVDPCGWFDLMDYCQGTPQHHLAYMKWRYGGWFAAIPQIPGPGDYTLNDIASSPFDCYWYPAGGSEWYVFEYRKQTGIYESTVPGTGLIVYRVRPDLTPNGNAGGPPDEVYVYRQGGTLTTNGNIYAAQYAMNLGHTALNNYTNPTPFLSNGSPGSLIMHHVSDDNAGTISFTIGTTAPHIWIGLSDSNWSNAANWNKGTVPVVSDYAIITGLNPPNWPVVNGAANCAALRIEQNMNNTGQLLINPGGIIFISADFDSWGVVTLVSNMVVGGNFTLHPGAQYNGFPSGSTAMQICGDCTFENGSVFNMSAGLVEFASAIPGGTHYFYNYTNTAYFFDVWLNKTPGTIYFSSSSTHPILINGNLLVGGGTTCYDQMAQDISVAGNLTINPGCHLYSSNGQMEFLGSTPQIIDFTTTDSYFFDLRVSNMVNLISNIRVHRNLYIGNPNGMLTPGPNTIFLGGNWWNIMGPPFFNHVSSRVVFNGNSDQFINTPMPSPLMAQFGIIEIAKPSGSLVINTPGQIIMCDFYDHSMGTLKVFDGIFQAMALLDNAIAGNMECHAPGIIDLNNPGGLVDMECSLGIFGGIVDVHGGTADSQWPGPSGSGCGITMTSGWLNFHDVGVVVDNIPFTLALNITGGKIKVNGSFDVQRNDFNPGGGTIEFTGTANAYIGMLAGSNFHNVVVNKSSRNPPLRVQNETTDPQLLRTNTLQTLSPLQINGNLEISSGSTFIMDFNINVTGYFTLMGFMHFSLPVVATISGTPTLGPGSTLNVMNGTFIVSNALPPTTINVDGDVVIEMGTLEVQDHGLNVSSTGDISFVGVGTGEIICAAFSATTAGSFSCGSGTLTMSNSSGSAVGLLDVAAGNDINNLKIDTAGIITYNDDVYTGSCEILAGQLSCTNDLAVLEVGRDWSEHVAHGFLPALGTVKFTGSVNSNIYSFTAIGTEFHDLIIEKDASTVYTYLHGRIELLGNGACEIVRGRLHVNGNILSIGGTTDIDNGGWLILDDDSMMEIGNLGWIFVNSGGTLEIQGSASHEVQMKGLSGGSWEMKVFNGGYVSAEYTDFTDLRGDGVCVDNSATVDVTAPFDYCSFYNGETGATLLTINNTQDLTITGLNFPMNSGENHNVAKQADYGTLTLNAAIGSFARPIYEDDIYDRIYWDGYNPNLIISGFNVSDPSPCVADQIVYSVTVLNDSDDPVLIPFKIHLFENRNIAPGWAELGDYDQNCPALAAHASYNYSFTGIYSMSPDNWKSWILIDPEGAVYESDETDNRSYTNVTWLALPEVSGVTMTLLSSTTGRISWTYPIWVDRFNVYYDSDPYGSFSSSIGSTSGNFLDVLLTPGMNFFQVKAERDIP